MPSALDMASLCWEKQIYPLCFKISDSAFSRYGCIYTLKSRVTYFGNEGSTVEANLAPTKETVACLSLDLASLVGTKQVLSLVQAG
jgi:hypothetical protein